MCGVCYFRNNPTSLIPQTIACSHFMSHCKIWGLIEKNCVFTGDIRPIFLNGWGGKKKSKMAFLAGLTALLRFSYSLHSLKQSKYHIFSLLILYVILLYFCKSSPTWKNYSNAKKWPSMKYFSISFFSLSMAKTNQKS